MGKHCSLEDNEPELPDEYDRIYTQCQCEANGEPEAVGVYCRCRRRLLTLVKSYSKYFNLTSATFHLLSPTSILHRTHHITNQTTAEITSRPGSGLLFHHSTRDRFRVIRSNSQDVFQLAAIVSPAQIDGLYRLSCSWPPAMSMRFPSSCKSTDMLFSSRLHNPFKGARRSSARGGDSGSAKTR